MPSQCSLSETYSPPPFTSGQRHRIPDGGGKPAVEGCEGSWISSLPCPQLPLTRSGHSDLAFSSLRAQGPQTWPPRSVRWIKKQRPQWSSASPISISRTAPWPLQGPGFSMLAIQLQSKVKGVCVGGGAGKHPLPGGQNGNPLLPQMGLKTLVKSQRTFIFLNGNHPPPKNIQIKMRHIIVLNTLGLAR